VYDWAKTFEQYWTHHLDRIKERAEQKMRAGGHERKNEEEL
jgi:hypothetical protein